LSYSEINLRIRQNILKKVLQNKIGYGILNVTEELFERYQAGINILRGYSDSSSAKTTRAIPY